MKTTNLGEADGLPTIEWSQVETQLADLLTHDDPLAEPLDVLADDPERRWEPARDECGRALARGPCWFQTGQRTRKAKKRCTRPALHDQCRHERLRRDGLRRSPAGDRPDDRGRDRGVVAESGSPAQPDDSGIGITAPFNAPTLGPPPWFVYEVKPRTVTVVGTAEETPGSTCWRF